MAATVARQSAMISSTRGGINRRLALQIILVWVLPGWDTTYIARYFVSLGPRCSALGHEPGAIQVPARVHALQFFVDLLA